MYFEPLQFFVESYWIIQIEFSVHVYPVCTFKVGTVRNTAREE